MTFEGSVRSKIAMLKLDSVVDELNDDTLDTWAELQQESGSSETTPLNPFMERELLKDNDLSLDGTAFTKETGFQWVFSVASSWPWLTRTIRYKHPSLTKQEVEAVIESYKRMNWWPWYLIPAGGWSVFFCLFCIPVDGIGSRYTSYVFGLILKVGIMVGYVCLNGFQHSSIAQHSMYDWVNLCSKNEVIELEIF